MTGRVVVEKPRRVRLGQEVAVGELVDRRVAGDHVGRRVRQQLRRRAARSAALLGNDRGQVAPGAVATHGHPGRVGTECGHVASGPVERGDRVVHGRGERVLGRQADRLFKHLDSALQAQRQAVTLPLDDGRVGGTLEGGGCRIRS